MHRALLVFIAVIAPDSVAQVVDTQKAIAGAYVPGETINPPEQALEFSLPVLEYGMGINFEAGYFQSEPIELPGGQRMGGDNMAKPVCQLSFKARVLTENTCATDKS